MEATAWPSSNLDHLFPPTPSAAADSSNLSPQLQLINDADIHKLCTGQVILNIAGAVKELIENALDAGATNIEIRLKESGTQCLEVADNGSGIKEENYEFIAKSHWTSKLSNFNDLALLSTFGFRGEALGALCALSDVVVVTRHVDSSFAHKLIFNNLGTLVTKSPISRQPGTTVTATNLFDPLPVRRKDFLKNYKVECQKLVEIVTAYCLCSTKTRIQCWNTVGGKRNLVVSTNSNAAMQGNIADVFGAKSLLSLVEFKQARPSDSVCEEFGIRDVDNMLEGFTFSINGFVSTCKHGEGRSAADRQFVYINSRPCTYQKVCKIANDVYHQFNRHQFPVIVLNLKLASDQIDVNVTPDKRQIFVQKDRLVLATIKSSLLQLYHKIAGTEPITASIASDSTHHSRRSSLLDSFVVRPNGFANESNASISMSLQDDSPEIRNKRDRSNSLSSCSSSGFATPSKIQRTTTAAPASRIDFGDVNLMSALGRTTTPSKATTKSRRSSGASGRSFMNTPLVKQTTPSLKQTTLDKHVYSKSVPKAFEYTNGNNNFSVTPVKATPARDLRSILSKSTMALMFRPASAEPFLNSHAPSGSFSVPNAQAPSKYLLNGGGVISSRKLSDEAIRRVGMNCPDNTPPEPLEPTPAASLLSQILPPRKFSAETRPPGGLSLAAFKAQNEHRQLSQQLSKYGIVCSSKATPEMLAKVRFGDELPSASTAQQQQQEQHPTQQKREVSPSKTRRVSPKKSPRKRVSPLKSRLKIAAENNRECAVQEDAYTGERVRVEVPSGSFLRKVRTVCVPSIEQLRQSAQAKKLALANNASSNSPQAEVYSVGIRAGVSSASFRQDKIPFPDANTAASATTSRNFAAHISPSDNKVAEKELTRCIKKEDFKRMKVIGQFNHGFIIALLNKDMFLIDQHASDEKYNFEDLQMNAVLDSQPLVVPKPLELTAMNESILLDNMEVFRKNGFDFALNLQAEPGKRVKLSAKPVLFNCSFDKQDVDELIYMLNDYPGVMYRPSRVRSAFASKACRRSVMIGTPLNEQEMTQIVRHMGEIEMPWNCPHGRPTMRHLFDLAKLDEK